MSPWDHTIARKLANLWGLYLLHRIKGVMRNCSGGLYRDDGLIVFNDATGPKTDRIRKDITEIFKSEGLKITTKTNTSTTNFLDITLHLENDQFCPRRKPNDMPTYINVSSNHPRTVIKQLPKMISRRISDLSSTIKEFDKAKDLYQDALTKSGHDTKIEVRTFHRVQNTEKA